MGFVQRIREFWRPTPPPTPQVILVPQETYDEIKTLQRQAEWIGRLAEDDERAFVYGEDGTVQFGMSQGQPGETMFSYSWAYSQCFFRPSYGAAFYINEAQHRIIRARSRAFCSLNPYWHGIQHNLKTHVVSVGHSWQVMPKDPTAAPDKKKLAKFQQELDDFYTGTGEYAGYGCYREVQNEKLDRKSRDGEYFLQYIEEDQHLRVRFVEPLLIWTPTEPPANLEVLMGIAFKRGDYERAKGYFIRRSDFYGGDEGMDTAAWSRMIPPHEIQHRKVNVDRGTPRGIPDTYWVQARLEQSLRTLQAMGTLVQVRAKIAMIRKRINALAGTVQPMLSAAAATTVAGPGGQVRNVFQYPYGAILDTNDSAEYQFPGQNIETDKIVASVQADLQAVATSMGLAEYMVSGSLGSSSYATAMVAEGPVVKTFEQHQQDTVQEDREVIDRVLDVAVAAGRVDQATRDAIRVEINPPGLAGRDAIQEAQARHIMFEDGVLSAETWQRFMHLDPATENAHREKEAARQLKQQAEEAKVMGPLTAPAGPNGAARGTGAQPRNRQASTARPFRPDQEPRQIQRASGATREEGCVDEALLRSIDGQIILSPVLDERLQEAYGAATKGEVTMASVWLTPDWLATVKAHISALPEATQETLYEPGVMGMPLGYVGTQGAWVIDTRAMAIKHEALDFGDAGNGAKWDFVSKDTLVVERSLPLVDRQARFLHEAVEFCLLHHAQFPYALSHRLSLYYEAEWAKELRPELKALATHA